MRRKSRPPRWSASAPWSKNRASSIFPGSEATSTAVGSPAFTLDGNVLGVFVVRSVSQKGGRFGMFSFRPEGLATIILSAEDILKAAKQAPEAKGGEEKKEEPKEKK